MTEPQFKPGDRVRVTVEGVVQKLYDDDSDEYTRIKYPTVHGMGALLTFRHGVESVKVEHIAPAEWPPRVGDLWRDKHNELWFFRNEHSSEVSVIGQTANGQRWDRVRIPSDFADLLGMGAPWTLVHREYDDPAEDDEKPGIPNACDDCETTGYNCSAHRSRS